MFCIYSPLTILLIRSHPSNQFGYSFILIFIYLRILQFTASPFVVFLRNFTLHSMSWQNGFSAFDIVFVVAAILLCTAQIVDCCSLCVSDPICILRNWSAAKSLK